jgi:hypothetical protein
MKATTKVTIATLLIITTFTYFLFTGIPSSPEYFFLYTLILAFPIWLALKGIQQYHAENKE